MILYHNSITCIPMSILDQQCNPINAVDPASASAVMWHTIRFPNTPPFLLGAGYIAPDDHNGPAAARAMGQAITNALAMSLPVVLVGDFNLIHPDWMDFTGHGSPTVAANAFASYLTSAALTVLNAVLIPDVITRPAPLAHMVRDPSLTSLSSMLTSSSPWTPPTMTPSSQTMSLSL